MNVGFNLSNVDVPEKMYKMRPVYVDFSFEGPLNEQELLSKQEQLLGQINQLIQNVQKMVPTQSAASTCSSSSNAAVSTSLTLNVKPIEANSNKIDFISNQSRSVLHVPIESKLIEALPWLTKSNAANWSTRVFTHSSLLNQNDLVHKIDQLKPTDSSAHTQNGLDVIVKQTGEATLWPATGNSKIEKPSAILDNLIQQLSALNIQVDNKQLDTIRTQL